MLCEKNWKLLRPWSLALYMARFACFTSHGNNGSNALIGQYRFFRPRESMNFAIRIHAMLVAARVWRGPHLFPGFQHLNPVFIINKINRRRAKQSRFLLSDEFTQRRAHKQEITIIVDFYNKVTLREHPVEDKKTVLSCPLTTKHPQYIEVPSNIEAIQIISVISDTLPA